MSLSFATVDRSSVPVGASRGTSSGPTNSVESQKHGHPLTQTLGEQRLCRIHQPRSSTPGLSTWLGVLRQRHRTPNQCVDKPDAVDPASLLIIEADSCSVLRQNRCTTDAQLSEHMKGQCGRVAVPDVDVAFEFAPSRRSF